MNNSSMINQSLTIVVVLFFLPFCRRLITMSGGAKIVGPPQQESSLWPLLMRIEYNDLQHLSEWLSRTRLRLSLNLRIEIEKIFSFIIKHWLWAISKQDQKSTRCDCAQCLHCVHCVQCVQCFQYFQYVKCVQCVA